MKKRLPIIEIILLLNLAIFFVLSIIINFTVNKGDALRLMGDSLYLAFKVFTRGNVVSKLFMYLIVVLLLGFIAYWIISIIRFHKPSLGPMYILLFFAFFLYTNGYTNLIVVIDAYVVILFMILIWLFASVVICFTKHIKEVKKLEEDSDNNE